MKRVHILSAVNAANISKSGSTYTIRDVCGATDGIVMNRRLYPGDQLSAAVASLNGKPAPAGHPKNAAGQHISAANGEALANSWIGAYCTNARHEAGRTLVDVIVNGDMAQALPQGQKLVERLDAAIAGTNADPIHVSTGLNLVEVVANGESRGKKYDSIATNLRYDHLAILMDEQGAGTPEQGVGMFLNSQGEEEPVEVVEVNSAPDDRRFEGLTGWVRKLLGNSELSFEQIHEGINKILPRGAWLREVFPSRVIYVQDDSKLFEQSYEISENGSVALIGQAVEVSRQVSYQPITNAQESDAVKDQIIAALNAAGIKTEGLDDGQALNAYNALVKKPAEDERDAEKEKVKKLEVEKTTAENAERDTLAAELAVNSALTVDDLKALPVTRLRELKAKAAPVQVGNSDNSQGVNEFAGYDLNKL